MKRTILIAATLLTSASTAHADVPLQRTSGEIAGNDRRVELRVEGGDAFRLGGLVGFSPYGDAISVGSTGAWRLARHRTADVRVHGRLSLDYFTEAPTGAGLHARLGVRTLLRSQHFGFFTGPVLDSALGFQTSQQRVSPGLQVGVGAGPKGWWPWLSVSSDIGYSIGGAGGGAVRATWFVSLTFDP